MVNVIKNGINFLLQKQQPDGNYFSLVSQYPNFQKGKLRPTIFFTALILQSLNALPGNDKTLQIKEKAANFLLSQKNENWTFNYWMRQSPEFKKIPYPDDLDDTFCALAAIFQYNPKIINGTALGKIVTTLTALEKQEGGPYCTWVVNSDSNKIWKDIDLAVNSNIAYFLSLQDIELPNITNLIEKSIEDKKFQSPYYASPYSVIYFISKFYTGGKKQQIIDYLFEQRNQQQYWNNPLDTALAILALLNFKVEQKKIKKSIAYLIENQQNGSWKPYPFVVDLVKKESTYYAGSSALTTVFCIEAIAGYSEQEKKNATDLMKKSDDLKKNYKTPKQKNDGEIKIYNDIIRTIRKNISILDDELGNQTQKIINKILADSKDKQIALLPYFFKKSLGKNGNKIPNVQIINLGIVNIYGWTAYDIYDNFLDDEGDPELISSANFLLRELTSILAKLPFTNSNPLFRKIMNGIDNANQWEVKNCRACIKDGNFLIPKNLPNYDDYSKLAERSMGHAIGPIAALFLLGCKENSSEIKNLILFFKHYIIARQLNDDAHDWERDIKSGHISSVVVMILKKWQNTKNLSNNQFDIQKNISELQKIFWFEVSVGVCNQVLKNIDLAKQSLSKINIITDQTILKNFLEPIAASARKALKEQEEIIKFLKTYR